MGMTKCPACSAEVSASAATCPKCGHPLKKQTSGCAWIALIALVLFGLVVCGRAVNQVKIDENGEAVVVPEPTAPALTAEIVEFQCTKSGGGSARVQGTIKNTSAVVLERLNLKAQFRDQGGALLDNGEGYVDNHALAPGASTPFEIIGHRVPYSTCQIVEVLAGFKPVTFTGR